MIAETSKVVTHSPEETHSFGMEFSAKLSRGDCVALTGDLGSGKTCLAQGICKGLGVSDQVTSPTYILINEYEGRDTKGLPFPVYHFDLYRLGTPQELVELGCDDFFYGSGICLIEWAELAGGLLPENTTTIQIETSRVNQRTFNITRRVTRCEK